MAVTLYCELQRKGEPRFTLTWIVPFGLLLTEANRHDGTISVTAETVHVSRVGVFNRGSPKFVPAISGGRGSCRAENALARQEPRRLALPSTDNRELF